VKSVEEILAEIAERQNHLQFLFSGCRNPSGVYRLVLTARMTELETLKKFILELELKPSEPKQDQCDHEWQELENSTHNIKRICRHCYRILEQRF